MQDCIGVYLHGFLSSGNSEKGQWLKAKVQQEHLLGNTPVFSEIYTPTYPIKSPEASVTEIERCLLNAQQKSNNIILLGSSMGGFYAQYFGQKYHIPYIMINPALNPTPIFKQSLGCHTNPATGESFCIDEEYINALQIYAVKELNQDIAALMLLDTDDEVVDVDLALQQYGQKENQGSGSRFKSVIFSGGDHRFIHMPQAWEDIQSFVKGC
ncbi:esterase YqiA [Thiomicrorhabdus immobilis]|uniref:Esterase YqiA n=1 Tax=Thiomicrorhabdus immobilis TaxID=2791037 RepID=A0ABN6CWF5_9GAMM|nr:YqiA/YcfP family alpha/beta fold hydrolase [Thiomicrorhabdus immobilis]BCN93403.1 esterase YqiA [Thiomicrorhabdus immobilis]